jgi:phospholipase/lecithinase/hemolysin
MNKTERKSTSFARWPLVVCLALLLAAPGWAQERQQQGQHDQEQSRFSGFVVFGTSLSDPGNAFALSGVAATAPDFTMSPLLIPSAPYEQGGYHFSNGPTWVEQWAKSVGLKRSAGAALATDNPRVTNFAVGAARAYNDGVNFNLTRQVDTFLQRSGGVASPEALYVIEMGSNDIRDAFQIYALGGNGGPILAQALGSIAANIQRLYIAGGREFLVWVAPNVALTPAIRMLPPAAQGLASMLTQSFNGNLAAVLAQLSAGLPGISFTRLDAYDLLNQVVADPGAFDLSNVTSSCVTPNVAPFICHHAKEYLFWDGIHPTKAGHAILAEKAAQVVPE